MVDDGDPVAERLGLVHVVSGDDDRAAAVVEAGKQLPQVAPGLRVQAGGRLVEEDHVRVVHKRAGDRQPLGLTARQVSDPGLGLVAQPDALQPLVGGARPDAVQGGHGVDLLARGEPFEEGRRLELDADPRQQRGVARPRSQRPSTLISPPSGLRSPSIISRVVVLPAPLGPRIPKNSPSADLEADSVDGAQVAVGHHEVGDLDRAHASTFTD